MKSEKGMKKYALPILVLLNLVALFAGGSRFLVTFADVPVQGIPASCSHAYHQGMADMQNYLFPCLPWLIGALAVNFGVAVVLLAKPSKPGS